MFDYDKFFAENPVDVHNQVERHQKIASLCLGKVLDVGCGTGSLSEYYLGDYHGFDFSSVAIQKAISNRRSSASFSVRDFTVHEPFNYSEFDTIVMAEFLEHIEFDSYIFENIRRLARPGMRLIISVPNYDRIPSPDHLRRFTVRELREKLSPLGNVKFHNWVGEFERIIVSVDLCVKQENVLTLGIIAKDEEKGIEHAILSCLGFVDDVIISVDDQTTDKTKEIAERYTKNVYFFKWCDDFAGARNQLLEKVKTPWIFWLDGHEYVDTPPSSQIKTKTPYDAFMCQITLENKSVVRYPRLHLSRLRYTEKVHNKLIAESLGVDKNIMIIHNRVGGQSPESTARREKQRHDMITRIMGDQIKKDKRNIRALMHIGLHYHARSNYRKAIKYYKNYLKYSKYQGERWYIRFNLAICYLMQNKLWRAEYQANILEQESPNRWENKHILGMIFHAQKEFFKSAKMFIESLEAKEQEAEYKPLKRDLSTTWNFIGECLYNLRQFSDASIAFHRASSFCEVKEFSDFLFQRAELMGKMAVEYKK